MILRLEKNDTLFCFLPSRYTFTPTESELCYENNVALKQVQMFH